MSTNTVTTLQRLKTPSLSPMDKAIRYYSILSEINNLELTSREVQLIAFTAIKGGINSPSAKEEFCTIYNSTSATITNMISKLKKLGIFVKEKGKNRINPVIVLDFNKEIVLQITLSHAEV